MLFCKFTEHPRSVRIEPTVIGSIASLPSDAGQKASRVCRIAPLGAFCVKRIWEEYPCTQQVISDVR